MTKAQAITLAESGFWENMTPREIATFQLFEDRICMPFSVFHEALEKTLGRPVFTSELGLNREGIKSELIGESPAPTFEQICEMIPEDKRVIILEVRSDDV